jgi:DNA modification methylase
MILTKIGIDRLTPHPENYNTHPEEQLRELEKSLEEFDQYKNIVVCNGVILAGHGLVEAAKRTGMTEIYALVRDDLTPEQQKSLLLADNATPAGAKPDHTALQNLLDSLPNIDAIPGITDEWLTAMNVTRPEENPLLTNPDDIPDVDEESEPITQPGDRWQLGEHYLLCGDCTKQEDVDRLMNGEKAELLFTSPPYADIRTYDGNDLSIETLVKFIPAFYPYAAYQVINLGIKRENHEIVEYWQEYIAVAKQTGYKFLSWNIWNREQATSIGLQTAMFPVFHEWLFVFGKIPKEINRTKPISEASIERAKYKGGTRRQPDGSLRRIKQVTCHDKTQIGSVLTVKHANTISESSHPAQFPVVLPFEYIEAMTDENDIVVDPFGGSGTTLIACEQTGRRCRMMEISPKYCDVIIQRWETLTGKTASLLTCPPV